MAKKIFIFTDEDKINQYDEELQEAWLEANFESANLIMCEDNSTFIVNESGDTLFRTETFEEDE